MSTFLDEFDETMHAPRRLAICSYLVTVDAAEFSALRESLKISDSSLSKQLHILSNAGYVTLEKVGGRGRPRTWLRLTTEGRQAFKAHVNRLRGILDLAPSAK